MAVGVVIVVGRSSWATSSAKRLRPYWNHWVISSMTVVNVKDAR